MRAIGMIETKGLVPSIESADAMMKAANVELLSQHFIGSGLVTVIVTGDVGSVTAAVDAGRMRAEFFDALVSSHIIARPANDVENVIQNDPIALTTSPEAASSLEFEKEAVISQDPEKKESPVISAEITNRGSTGVVTSSVAEETREPQKELQKTDKSKEKESQKNKPTITEEQKKPTDPKVFGGDNEERRKTLQTHTVMELRQKVRRDKNAKISEKQLKSTTKDKLINLIIESGWNVT